MVLAAASAAARGILISRAAADLSRTPTLLPTLSHHLLIRPSKPAPHKIRSTVACWVSGVDGGGVPDEFVSTRKSGYERECEFSVISDMLKRIEPLDNSIISKTVSEFAKDSMKQTISTMLGLLPSDQFSVTVEVSRQPLDRLIVSSIVTGYTLWNAEYRMSLARNFDIPLDFSRRPDFVEDKKGSELRSKEEVSRGGYEGFIEDSEVNLRSLGQLSPEALNLIQQLESELATIKKEIEHKKQENSKMEDKQKSDNNLLEYLRSLDSEMVTELSRPASLETKEIIHELAQSTLKKCFDYEDHPSDYEHGMGLRCSENSEDTSVESRESICTSRDYLAKLLFWCMVLGHHLRGLENRVQLSCVVGLL